MLQYTIIMPKNVKRNTSGFTLVEIVISLLILAFAAVGLVKFLISIQYTAEDNLYESTALTVALSTLEQMKNAAPSTLDGSIGTSTFNLDVGADQPVVLNLGEENTRSIPIITNAESPKFMDLRVTPNIQSIAGETGFWLSVQYQYDLPRNGRTQTKVMECIRSKIPSF